MGDSLRQASLRGGAERASVVHKQAVLLRQLQFANQLLDQTVSLLNESGIGLVELILIKQVLGAVALRL